jgi:acetyltransferase-like isoleucine patch superfamily enzyme
MLKLTAVVIPGRPRLSSRREGVPGAHSQLVGRPFVQHVVESVVGLGIRDLHFILTPDDRSTRSALGDGTRWGARFIYHRVAEGGTAYDAVLEHAKARAPGRFLVVHADRLASIRLDAEIPASTLFCWRDIRFHWTGWAFVRGEDVRRIPAGVHDEGDFWTLLQELGGVSAEVPRPLSARTYHDLLESNRRVLSGECPGLLFGARQVRPGLWIGRNAHVHRTAELTPPAFLGENCRIGARVQIGPAASVGKNCVIERETHVTDSVVYAGSHVGRQLALRGVVVDHSRLISTRWDAEIDGVDKLLLDSVAGVPVNVRIDRACRAVAGAAALVVAAPCLGLLFVSSRLGVIPALTRQSAVQIPTVSESYRWTTFPIWSFGPTALPTGRTGWVRHFFFCLLPGLLPITAGHMNLVGPRARTIEEVERLPLKKRSAYLHGRPGILAPPAPSASDVDGDVSGVHDHEEGWLAAATTTAGYAARVVDSCRCAVSTVARRSRAK